MPPDVLLDPHSIARLAREHPPHQRFPAFLHAVRRARVEARDPVERVLAAYVRLTTPDGLARAWVATVQWLAPFSAAQLGAVREGLGAAWPDRHPAQTRTLVRVDAMLELARLREAGRITPGAARRVLWLLDPNRPPDPPEDLTFPEPSPVGLREAGAVLAAEAPTLWPLVSAELARLGPRLDTVPT